MSLVSGPDFILKTSCPLSFTFCWITAFGGCTDAVRNELALLGPGVIRQNPKNHLTFLLGCGPTLTVSKSCLQITLCKCIS